jgi:hypothetical protein
MTERPLILTRVPLSLVGQWRDDDYDIKRAAHG